MKNKIVIVLAFGSAMILGCSKNSDTPTTSNVSYTAGGTAFKAVTSSLSSAEGLISTTVASSSISQSDFGILAGGLTAKWEVATSYPNPKYNVTECPTTTEPSNITLKKYMGTQFDDNQVRCNGSAINIFGRLNNAAGILCIIMNKLSATTSAELATSGSASFTMDAATKSDLSTKCPMMSKDLNNETSVPTGTTVTMTFSAPAVTSTYDLKMQISPFNNTLLLKYNSNEIAFANNEDNSNGNQRVLVHYNQVTKVLRAEYVSKSKGSNFPLYVHRLYKDETNQEARILSAIQSGYAAQNNATSSNSEIYSISGYPGNNSIAFSLKLTGMGSLADGTHEACINGSNGSIVTDGPSVTSNSFSCGSTASTGRDIPYVTAISSINTSTAVAVPSTWWVLSSGSEVLNWSTKDNMLTQGL